MMVKRVGTKKTRTPAGLDNPVNIEKMAHPSDKLSAHAATMTARSRRIKLIRVPRTMNPRAYQTVRLRELTRMWLEPIPDPSDQIPA
jgi:hypothetical protein